MHPTSPPPFGDPATEPYTPREEPPEEQWAGTFFTAGPVYGGVTVDTDAGFGAGTSFGRRVTPVVGWTVFAAAADIPEEKVAEHDTAWALMGGAHFGNVIFGQVLGGFVRSNERVSSIDPNTGDVFDVPQQKTVFGVGASAGMMIPVGNRFGLTIQFFGAKGFETEGLVVFGMIGPTFRIPFRSER